MAEALSTPEVAPAIGHAHGKAGARGHPRNYVGSAGGRAAEEPAPGAGLAAGRFPRDAVRHV